MSEPYPSKGELAWIIHAAGDKMHAGLSGVQTLIGDLEYHPLESEQTPDERQLLYESIKSLATASRLLSSEGKVPDAFAVLIGEQYPTLRLADTALLAIVSSPLLIREHKKYFIDGWCRTVSTGQGQLYPNRIVASWAVPEIIERHIQAPQTTTQDKADLARFARYFERQRPAVKLHTWLGVLSRNQPAPSPSRERSL